MTTDALVMRHLRFGWWSLLVYLTLGLVLEALHGLKIGWYLAPGYDTRRLVWTLAHAHGTLLALVHLGFASLLRTIPRWSGPPRDRASQCLRAASVLLPGGFFMGGIVIHGGDPGIGILLVPLGGVVLLIGVALAARATYTDRP